jgi:hypothetical protein
MIAAATIADDMGDLRALPTAVKEIGYFAVHKRDASPALVALVAWLASPEAHTLAGLK